MQLDEFLHNLHFDIDKVRPVDLAVDWEDAPLPYKLYQDLPVIPLPAEVPLSINSTGLRSQSSIGLKEIGNFLWYSYGLTQLSHSILPPNEGREQVNYMQMLRRYAPSGGALYPSELYVYLKIGELQPGIYHYDVAHHRLVLLREGTFDEYLERALGHRCDMSSRFGAIFVSTMFWKNFYKYNNFAYRLQGIDAGALMGQLLEVAKQYGYASFVYFQFLDSAINHLLGLCDEEESTYAVIPLSLDECAISTGRVDCAKAKMQGTRESAETLCRELIGLQHRYYVKSKRMTSYPLIVQLNEAAMLHSTEPFTHLPKLPSRANSSGGSLIALPEVQSLNGDFAATCRGRYSPGLDFIGGHSTLAELSTLLAMTTSSFPYNHDLDSASEVSEARIAIVGCVHGIDGLVDGAYLYDPEIHGLRLLRTGDQRMPLQQAMSMPNVNLFQVPFCLHLVGHRDTYQTTYSYRGYRIQQMEVGMLLQRLLLAASALGMNGHPLLGYDESACDDIYNFGQQGRTCLIQVPVGRYRKVSKFEGALRG